jgi:hypothetical protein
MKASERLAATEAAIASEKIPRVMETATTAAAATNHFSCWRSSPLDPRKRTPTDTAESTNVTGNASTATLKTIRSNAGSPRVASSEPANGSDQTLVARVIEPAVRHRSPTPASQATGRHLLEGGCPVGNSRNRNGSRQIAMGSRPALSQASNLPPGRTPGSTTRT